MKQFIAKHLNKHEQFGFQLIGQRGIRWLADHLRAFENADDHDAGLVENWPLGRRGEGLDEAGRLGSIEGGPLLELQSY